MKHFLGLLLLCLPLSTYARSNSATLYLRAVVPTVYKVDVRMGAKGPIVKVSSNHPHHRKHGLRIKISQFKNVRMVALTQP